MHKFLERLVPKAKKRRATIVLAEAEDERVIRAAAETRRLGIAELILLGRRGRIDALKKRLNLSFDALIIDPARYETDFSDALYKCRRGKMTRAEAARRAKDPRYFAALLVQQGLADGAVSGNQSTTATTLSAALQVLGTPSNVKAFSSFLMLKDDSQFLFGDCALNPSPDEKLLGAIAAGLAREAEVLGLKPRVAMLSYSTDGSGGGEAAEKVRKAVGLAKRRGVRAEELQVDAALIPAVAKQKAPGSRVAGKANVFVFPDLMAGNIGYKLAERLGGFHAVGPLVHGLKRPMNDLSRGCSSDDVVAVVLLTALQG